MGEQNGCGRVALAFVKALVCAVIALYGTLFLMGNEFPSALVANVAGLVVFFGCWWAFARVEKEPPPPPPPEPVQYGYVCDDCKKGVDQEAKVCPFCQARFSGGSRRNNARQRNEKLTKPRG